MAIYDDFLGTELDRTKWNSYTDAGCTQTVHDGVLTLSNSATEATVNSVYTKKTDWSIGKYRARVIPKSGDSPTSVQLSLFKGDMPLPDEMAMIKITGTDGTIKCNTRRGGSWDTGTTLGVATFGQPYELEIEVTSDRIIFRAFDADGNLIGTETRTTLPNFGFPSPTFTVDLRNGLGSAGGSQDGDFDWIDCPEEYFAEEVEEVEEKAPVLIAGIPVVTWTIIGVVVVIIAVAFYFALRRR